MDATQLQEFSALIGTIYDSVLSPEAWPDVLRAVCAYVKAETAALFSHDLFDRKPPWQMQVGYDPHWMRVYTETYLAMNPYIDVVASLGAGECAYSSAREDYPALLQSQFYQGWLKPQGFVDASVLVLDKTTSSIATLVNVRTERQGLFDDAVLPLLQAIYPHLRRAILIGRVIGDLTAQTARLAAVMDSLAAGMFLVSKGGKLTHANAAGEAMLSAGSPLKNLNGRLVFADEAANRTLRQAFAGAEDSLVALGGTGVSIPVSAGPGADFIAHMLPLSPKNKALIGAEDGASFVLFVKRNDPADGAAITAFAKRFGLTPKESQVLRTIVDVGGVPPAAEVLGLSANTVRSHVTSIFDKTGVRRQADLIDLLKEMKSPFATQR